MMIQLTNQNLPQTGIFGSPSLIRLLIWGMIDCVQQQQQQQKRGKEREAIGLSTAVCVAWDMELEVAYDTQINDSTSLLLRDCCFLLPFISLSKH